MNVEQVKVEKFFDRLLDKTVKKTVMWFLVSMFVFFIMLLCMMPAQEIFMDSEDAPELFSIILVLFSFTALGFRIGPYMEYTENQKSRFITDILKFYPVSKKVIWKLKMKTAVMFLGKITGVGLVVQLVSSFIAYHSISWVNFFYVIGFIFVFPVVGEFVFDSIMKTYIEE